MPTDLPLRRWFFGKLVVWALAYGLCLLFVGEWIRRSPLLRQTEYLRILLWLSLVCVAIACLIVREDLRASLRALRAVGPKAWAGLIGNLVVLVAFAGCLLLLGLGTLLWWNQAADRSPRMTLHVPVRDKVPPRHLIIEAWQLSKDPIPLAVKREFFEQVQPGDQIRLVVGRGALNVAWFPDMGRVD